MYGWSSTCPGSFRSGRHRRPARRARSFSARVGLSLLGAASSFTVEGASGVICEAGGAGTVINGRRRIVAERVNHGLSACVSTVPNQAWRARQRRTGHRGAGCRSGPVHRTGRGPVHRHAASANERRELWSRHSLLFDDGRPGQRRDDDAHGRRRHHIPRRSCIGATANTGSTVVLAGANACNVFWQVSSAATLNGASFAGNIVAQAGVTLGVGAQLVGRALATVGPVTLSGTNLAGGCASNT